MRVHLTAFVLFIAVNAGAAERWQSLFNGSDLTGWTPKIRGYETGDDPLQTFRVENGLLTVSYSNYDKFDNRFGHLFCKTPYSHYRLRLEYRFIGEQVRGGEPWAFRNSGVMVHSQDPFTMPAGQDFPISIEVQFLGGAEAGKPRPTANMCSPGTHIVLDGVFTETHCVPSRAPTFYGDDWIHVEVLVEGSERIVHYINGEEVLSYGGITTGGGVVSGHRPEMKPEGAPLEKGYISLQSESHPIQFRNIEILELKD